MAKSSSPQPKKAAHQKASRTGAENRAAASRKPMTKAMRYSVERIRREARIIEELVPKELKSESQRRRHQLESAYSYLTTHAGKLHLNIPSLGVFYSPQTYLANARSIVEQLPSLQDDESSTQDTTDTLQEDLTEFMFSDLLRSLQQKRGYASEVVEQSGHQLQQSENETVGWVGYEPLSIVPENASQGSTDVDLIEQAAAGNERAFELLVQRYETQIRQFVYRHVSCFEDAQDIVQFVFLQLYLFLPRLQGNLIYICNQRPINSWLFTVARNRCYDERRKKRPYLFSELETATEEEINPLEYIPDTAPLPEDVVEQQNMLQDAIQALPSRFRAIVSLRYREELTFREIGHRLNIPENTAKTYFQRARPLLRASLASLSEECS